MKAKILSIYEEGSLVNTSLVGAIGFSLLVDVDGERTLFDTGRKGKHLLHNLALLDVPVESISRIVLSHGHRDHTGGLNELLEERETPVAIYAHPDCWQPRSSAIGAMRTRNIGSFLIDEENVPKTVLTDAEGWVKLSDNLFIMSLPLAEPDGKHKKLVDKKWIDDTFSDEIALVLTTKKGPVLITGCAHTGIINSVKAVKERTGKDVFTVVGGVHMVKMKKPVLDGIATALLEDIKTPALYLSHCTTPESKTRLRTKLGLNGVKEFYVGTAVEFEL